MITSAAAIRFSSALLRVVPVPVVRALAMAAGTLAYYALGARRATLLDSLAHLAPNDSPSRRRRLARRTFRNLASAAVDLLRLPSARPGEVQTLFVSRGLEHVDAARALRKGLIIVTPHLSAYELGGAWMASRGYPVHAMVEDLAPDVLEAMATYRQATGMKLVSMKQGVRAVFRLLKAEEIVILVADRAIGDAASAVKLPFGDGVRPVPTGPATFALGTGAPVVVGWVSLNPERHPRYVVTFNPPLLPQGAGEEGRLALTRLIADQLAAAVRLHPDEWFVFQPQWESRDRN